MKYVTFIIGATLKLIALPFVLFALIITAVCGEDKMAEKLLDAYSRPWIK